MKIDEKGATMIEFTIALPIFLLSIAVLVELGFGMARQAIYTDALSIAARDLAVNAGGTRAECQTIAQDTFTRHLDDFGISHAPSIQLKGNGDVPPSLLVTGQSYVGLEIDNWSQECFFCALWGTRPEDFFIKLNHVYWITLEDNSACV